MATGKLNTAGLLDYFDLNAMYATEFRRLLHNLNGQSKVKDLKTVLITSSMLSEGKSTVASFLAMTTARLRRKKTLLIDCDLRRPMLHRLFPLTRENGVTEVMKGDRKVKEVIKKTQDDLLDIITAGRAVRQPTEIFESSSIGKLIDEVRFYYDLIIVDCAPLLPVSDPMLLAAEMDGVILVVKAGSTQREVVRRAALLLKNNKSCLLGVVLNNLNNALPYYYNEGYYGYEYKPRQPRKIASKTKTKTE